MTMTSDEFYAKCKGFMKLNPGLTFVIETRPQSDLARQETARAAWLDYLDRNGLRKTAASWRMIWAGGGKAVTVPTENPGVFDLSYVPSEQNAYRKAKEGSGRPWRDPSQGYQREEG
jgi:hypothetical protein